MDGTASGGGDKSTASPKAAPASTPAGSPSPSKKLPNRPPARGFYDRYLLLKNDAEPTDISNSNDDAEMEAGEVVCEPEAEASEHSKENENKAANQLTISTTSPPEKHAAQKHQLLQQQQEQQQRPPLEDTNHRMPPPDRRDSMGGVGNGRPDDSFGRRDSNGGHFHPDGPHGARGPDGHRGPDNFSGPRGPDSNGYGPPGPRDRSRSRSRDRNRSPRRGPNGPPNGPGERPRSPRDINRGQQWGPQGPNEFGGRGPPPNQRGRSPSWSQPRGYPRSGSPNGPPRGQDRFNGPPRSPPRCGRGFQGRGHDGPMNPGGRGQWSPRGFHERGPGGPTSPRSGRGQWSPRGDGPMNGGFQGRGPGGPMSPRGGLGGRGQWSPRGDGPMNGGFQGRGPGGPMSPRGGRGQWSPRGDDPPPPPNGPPRSPRDRPPPDGFNRMRESPRNFGGPGGGGGRFGPPTDFMGGRGRGPCRGRSRSRSPPPRNGFQRRSRSRSRSPRHRPDFERDGPGGPAFPRPDFDPRNGPGGPPNYYGGPAGGSDYDQRGPGGPGINGYAGPIYPNFHRDPPQPPPGLPYPPQKQRGRSRSRSPDSRRSMEPPNMYESNWEHGSTRSGSFVSPASAPPSVGDWSFELMRSGRPKCRCRGTPTAIPTRAQLPLTVNVIQLPHLTKHRDFLMLDRRVPFHVYELAPESIGDQGGYNAFRDYLLTGKSNIPRAGVAMEMDAVGFKIFVLPPGSAARAVGYKADQMIAVLRQKA